MSKNTNFPEFLPRPCPKVRTLRSFLARPYPKVRTLLRIFAKSANRFEVLASMCPKNANPFEGLAWDVPKSVNFSEIVVNVCPKVRTLSRLWRRMCPKVRTLCIFSSKMWTLLIICLNVRSNAKTPNPSGGIGTKSAPPHDRPKNCIFVMNLWRQNAIKMVALILTFLLRAVCGRKLRTLCAQAKKCKKVRTLYNPPPKCAELCANLEPFMSSAQKSEPFVAPLCASPPVTFGLRVSG